MQIKWSQQSLDDLSEILRYVVESFGQTVAYRVNREIHNDVDTLVNFPLTGRVYFHDEETGITYRTLTSKYHKVLYYIEGNVVKIVLLWNNRRDNSKLTNLLQNTK